MSNQIDIGSKEEKKAVHVELFAAYHAPVAGPEQSTEKERRYNSVKPHIPQLSLCHLLFKAFTNERTSTRNERFEGVKCIVELFVLS